jgi:hypothetical protein
MNIVLLYLLLLKGTVTAFAGLASLPVIQESLVNHYHVLTNEQLNEAVVITRSSPGPVGLYIVSVGYFAAGLPGAVAGWLAMTHPDREVYSAARSCSGWIGIFPISFRSPSMMAMWRCPPAPDVSWAIWMAIILAFAIASSSPEQSSPAGSIRR